MVWGKVELDLVWLLLERLVIWGRGEMWKRGGLYSQDRLYERYLVKKSTQQIKYIIVVMGRQK